jgi:hypothetical protein
MTGWQDFVITLGDWLLSWTLGYPRDLTLLFIACFTSAALLVIRRVFGHHQQLRQIAEDERRLRTLISEARAEGDSDAARRHRRVRRWVALQRLRAEIRPGLVGLLLGVVIVTWGNHRLNHLPLREEQLFDFSVTRPASAVGSVVHVVPQSGLSTDGSWIRPVKLATEGSMPLGQATWRMCGENVGTLDRITIRHRGATFEHPIVIDGRTPPQDVVTHEGDTTTRLHLKTYRPFGLVPGMAILGLAPWLVGLAVLTLGGYLGAKRLLRIP